MTTPVQERVVAFEDVVRAIEACSNKDDLWYETDNDRRLPERLGFEEKWQVSLVFVHLKQLRRQGKLQKRIVELREIRHHKHGGRRHRVRKVYIVPVDGATLELTSRRSLGYLAR